MNSAQNLLLCSSLINLGILFYFISCNKKNLTESSCDPFFILLWLWITILFFWS